MMNDSMFTDAQITEMKEKIRAEILRGSVSNFKSEIVEGLMCAGISKDQAESVLSAVVAKKVPHMNITY